jgi:hypothetical protein
MYVRVESLISFYTPGFVNLPENFTLKKQQLPLEVIVLVGFQLLCWSLLTQVR